jgi:hypothetical protein
VTGPAGGAFDPATVQGLWDIEQIKQLKARYFRLVDTRDWAGVVALFTTDCMLRSSHFPDGELPGPFFASVAQRIHPGISVHHGHMPEITLTSPSTATGIWAMADFVDTDDPGFRFHGYGHYHESYLKEPRAGWLISAFELRRMRVDRYAGPPGPWPR